MITNACGVTDHVDNSVQMDCAGLLRMDADDIAASFDEVSCQRGTQSFVCALALALSK